jgi:predicted DCC family thiol-disulfide oxidoreductase YuxK
MPAILHTKPPGKYVVLYDGHCRFCAAQSQKLTAIARRAVVTTADFQESGILDKFPGISHEACMQAMHLVTPDGRVYRGFEAIVQAIATRPVLGLAAYVYYLPGLRQLCDRLYAFVAANRYRLWGRNRSPSHCESGTCALHFPRANPSGVP